MPSARLIIDQLRVCGITHVVALPDNTSKALLEALAVQPDICVVNITREGEAWAVASGLWIGGATPAVLMQNTGFLESGDALRGTAMRMRIPLLCLLTYRGYASLTAVEGRGPSSPNPWQNAHGLRRRPAYGGQIGGARLSSQPRQPDLEFVEQSESGTLNLPDVQLIDARVLSRNDVDSCAVLFEPTLRAWGMPFDFFHDDCDVVKIRTAFQLARQREHPAALLITRDTS